MLYCGKARKLLSQINAKMLWLTLWSVYAIQLTTDILVCLSYMPAKLQGKC